MERGRWHMPYAGQSPAGFPPSVTSPSGQNWQTERVVTHSGRHMNPKQQQWQQQEAMPSWQHDTHANLPPYSYYQVPANQLHCCGVSGGVHFPGSCLQPGAVAAEQNLRSHETQNQQLISGQPMFQNVTARPFHPHFQGPPLAGTSRPSDIQLVSSPAYPCSARIMTPLPMEGAPPLPMEGAPPLPDEPPAPDEEPPPLPPDIINAADLFENPGRKSRPSRIAIILRGAPGSGKSWAAAKLRGIEVQNGADPPRIHSLDAYFMQESVETVVDERGRKRKVTSEVYEYEAEMEERYTDDLIKSFRRTVEDRNYAVVIVDAPNGSNHRLSEMWDAGQKGGYEVYIAESLEHDPKLCFKQNQHGRTLQQIENFLTNMEQCPNMYPQLDLKPLLISSNRSRGIREIEMEVETIAVLQTQQCRPKRRRLTEPDKDNSNKAGNQTRWDNFDDSTH